MSAHDVRMTSAWFTCAAALSLLAGRASAVALSRSESWSSAAVDPGDGQEPEFFVEENREESRHGFFGE